MNSKIYFVAVFIFSYLGHQVYSQAPLLTLEPFRADFSRPTSLATANDSRIFVGEIGGKIKIIANNTTLTTPFLDISAKVQDAQWAGIYSFVFHPNYAQNGRFYVLYIRKPDNLVQLSQFRRSMADSNQANPTEIPLLTIPHALSTGHRGGCLRFGKDGYLYISTGDDGDGGRGVMGDPLNNAQNLSVLFGKLLRIDVNSNNNTYTIPADNPYHSNNGTIPKEIWARGLRNPWRFSFDRATGDLWLGDNGQDGWEEVNFLASKAKSGANFGWRCFEGNHRYVNSTCQDSATFYFPLHEYPGFANNGGINCSVIGGFVYRGQQFAGMYGDYVYADYGTGKFWALRRNQQGGYQLFPQSITINSPVTFGEDKDGELYVASFMDGIIYKIKAQACPSSLTLTTPMTGAATLSASESITASNVISASSHVTYSAGRSIELKAGFNAQQGSYFSAQISNCPTSTATADQK
jgi:glucose/arabinose dehydrogenase